MKRFERIVLIDDNEADNVYHEIIIRRAGFTGEILVFESGIDALAYFAQDDLSRPTGIFLDINMPLMDGFEVATGLAPMIEGKPATVLVMLTSSGSSADRERAQAISVIQGYVTKPLTVDVTTGLMAGPL